jgi:tetratricopeptide (TPR) repeat protein
VLRAAIAILAFALTESVCLLGSQQETAGSLEDQEQSSKYEAAIASYKKLLQSSAQAVDVIQVRTDLAIAYFMLHRYSESLEALKPVMSVGESRGTKIPAQAWTVRGLDHLELNELSPAIEAFRKGLEIDPNAGTARMGLGDAYARSGRLPDAIQEYETQAQRTPSLAEPWYKLGLAHAKLASELPSSFPEFRNSIVGRQLAAEEQLAGGNNMEAARALFHLLNDAPNQPELNADLGTALLALGHVKPAERHFGEELSRDSFSPQAALGLAQVSALNGDWMTAFSRLEQLARSQPSELMRLLDFPPSGPLRQAWTDHRLQIPDDLASRTIAPVWSAWLDATGAAPSLLKAIVTPPELCETSISAAAAHPGAWFSEACYRRLTAQLRRNPPLTVEQRVKLAEAEFRLGEHDAALREAEQILNSDARNVWGMYWLSKAQSAIAEDCFVKVGLLNPQSPRMHEMLAQHYLGWSDYPKAKAEYLAALRIAPQLPDLHLGLGSVYWKAGELPESEKELEKTLELVPESAAAHYELGDVYIQERQWQRAIPHLQHAVKSSFEQEARIDLAKAEDELGKTQQAIQDLLPIAKQDPDGQIHFLLASFYRKLGDTAQVRSALAAFKNLRAASLEGQENDFDALGSGNESNKSSNRSGSH